ncbi:cobalamin biosynthesis protein [Methanobrevibacter curvatus]|uniref:Probable cobalamin biosynthesis protein CobD n=1 Tax=Methanobrevibacter curvatus TaxID=49547 RepID=A0A166D7J4_9EURY|nr:cobalamin biosynthesis protein [Methanobrevibacter curvatus]KZX15288.1 cobalamin biosynthesis protein CbiB [Methanobrevibacter curvatus]
MIFNNSIFLQVFLPLLILILAIVIDLIFGELPSKLHPVVLIGKLISIFQKSLIKFRNKLSGFILTICVVFAVLCIFYIILFIGFSINFILFIILSVIILSSSFSIKFLFKSSENVFLDLNHNIKLARKSLSMLVSRDTKELNEKKILSALIETTSENITDSVISVFFYLFLFNGIFIILKLLNLNNIIFSNVFFSNIIFDYHIIYFDIFNYISFLILLCIFYRVINTLDGMVGYKNDKYSFIGYFPAKLDDVLNYIPSRIAGFFTIISAYFLGFDWKNAYKILIRDSRNTPSPNSGFTMAATAGALNVQLEKEGVYTVGDKSHEIGKKDFYKAIKLNKLSCFLAFAIFLFLTLGLFLILFYF